MLCIEVGAEGVSIVSSGVGTGKNAWLQLYYCTNSHAYKIPNPDAKQQVWDWKGPDGTVHIYTVPGIGTP
jgi:hypothetical protein